MLVTTGINSTNMYSVSTMCQVLFREQLQRKQAGILACVELTVEQEEKDDAPEAKSMLGWRAYGGERYGDE